MNEQFFYFLHIITLGFFVIGFLKLPYIFKGMCWVIALMLAFTIAQLYAAH